MEMHQAGKFPIERLCKVYPVENLNEAIHDMHTGNVRKSTPVESKFQWLIMTHYTGDQTSYIMGTMNFCLSEAYT